MLRTCLTAGSLILLAACGGDVLYTSKSPAMDVQQARATVQNSMTRGANVWLGEWDAPSAVYEVRFRRDAFAIAVQRGAIDWSLFNDVKYAPPSMKVCPLANASTSVIYGGPFGNNGPCAKYFVRACGMIIGFCSQAPAQSFADALYVLKANSN